MTLPYTGNGPYCYTNSLYMCLQGAGVAHTELPEAGFVECLTTMPFGAGYLRLEHGPVAFLSPITVNPDVGLARALNALGWTCEDQYGDDPGEAQLRLQDALQYGPALVGPVDMGYLSYHPGCRHEPAGDHYVAALGATEDGVLLHDPDGYPCAAISMEELLVAWRAESVQYKQGSYRLRSNFRQIRTVTRDEMIGQTLVLIREDLTADPGGPVAYGGVRALRMLAQQLREEVGQQLHGTLVSFVFPLASRRSLDASQFLVEAGLGEAAAIMDRQAVLCGQAQTLTIRKRFAEVATVVDCLAEAQQRLATLL